MKLTYVILIIYVVAANAKHWAKFKTKSSWSRPSNSEYFDDSNKIIASNDEDEENVYQWEYKNKADSKYVETQNGESLETSNEQVNEEKDVSDDIPLKIHRRNLDWKSNISSKEINMKTGRRIYHSNIAARRQYFWSTTPKLSSESSTKEIEDWKKAYQKSWQLKTNKMVSTSGSQIGDKVNILGARPWGVKCGDGAAIGSCLLLVECEPEHRIARGDHYCGRTQFACCSIELKTFDNYQGIDESFNIESLESDPDIRKPEMISKERKKLNKERKRQKRRRDRRRRKLKIARTIRVIVAKIHRLLKAQSRNGTRERMLKTRFMKNFIFTLKKRYKHDRDEIKHLHDQESIKMDAATLVKLNQVREANQDFAKNPPFKDALLNGTITKKTARMLIEAYPDLEDFLNLDDESIEQDKGARRSGVQRSIDQNSEHQQSGRRSRLDKDDDDRHYDVEYGYIYF